MQDSIVVAKATALVIDSDAFELASQADRSLTTPFKVIDYTFTEAAWGERWYKVLLLTRTDPAATVSVIEYGAAKGGIGFNDLMRPQAAQFLDAFFENTWTWSDQPQQFVRYDNVSAHLERPSQFAWLGWRPSAPPTPHTAVLYHSPDEKMQKMMRCAASKSASTDQSDLMSQVTRHTDGNALQKLRGLFELSAHCQFISAWPPNLSRPRVISAHDTLFLSRVQHICSTVGLKMSLVESEDLLPIW